MWNYSKSLIENFEIIGLLEFGCKRSLVQSNKDHKAKVNKKNVFVVIPSLDDLCSIYLLLYDEESIAQCEIF